MSLTANTTPNSRRPRSRWLAGALALGLSVALGCASVRVSTDFDDKVDFTVLNRFAWVEPPELEGQHPFLDNALLRKRVREAVTGALRARGYEPSPSDAADFLVTFHVTIQERLRVHHSPSISTGYGRYYGRGHIGVHHGTSYAQQYQEGTLVIDLLGPGEDELWWRGWARDAVPTPDIARDRIDLAVEKILERFPPAPAAS